MTQENATTSAPAPERWRVRVNMRDGRDHWVGQTYANPIQARVHGMIWAGLELRRRARLSGREAPHLDWVAPNQGIAIAYDQGQPLATVSSVPA